MKYDRDLFIGVYTIKYVRAGQNLSARYQYAGARRVHYPYLYDTLDESALQVVEVSYQGSTMPAT